MFIDAVLVSLLITLNLCIGFSRICMIIDVEHVFSLLENDMLNFTSESALKRKKEKWKKRTPMASFWYLYC